MSKKKKDLEDSIDQCRQKMERAEKLIGGLGGEQENWKTSSNNLDFRLQQLPGDVLLSASIITYLGAMKNEQRAVRNLTSKAHSFLIAAFEKNYLFLLNIRTASKNGYSLYVIAKYLTAPTSP